LFVERIKSTAEAHIGTVIIGELFEPVSVDRIDLRLRLSGRDPLLQPTDNAVAARTARLQFAFRKSDRLPDINAFRKCPTLHAEKRERKLKSSRHYPDDSEIAAVQRDFFPDKIWIGVERALPTLRT